jgi:hypothetical protein
MSINPVYRFSFSPKWPEEHIRKIIGSCRFISQGVHSELEVKMIEIFLIRNSRITDMSHNFSPTDGFSDSYVFRDIIQMGIDGNMARTSFQIDSIATIDIEIFLLFEITMPWQEVSHLIP